MCLLIRVSTNQDRTGKLRVLSKHTAEHSLNDVLPSGTFDVEKVSNFGATGSYKHLQYPDFIHL